MLVASGIVRAGESVKLLSDDTKLTRKLTLKIDHASQSARDQVAAAGGTLELAAASSGNGSDAAAKGSKE